MWYGEMCFHLYDLLDVLAAEAIATTAAAKAKAAATTEAIATTAKRFISTNIQNTQNLSIL